MTPTLHIHTGDALGTLRTLPAASVQCVVTSPPYFGLRAYHTEPVIWDAAPFCEHSWGDSVCRLCNAWRGELGLEPTVDLYISHLVQVFAEVRRVLRRDGTLWVNLADSYAANRGYQVPDSKHKDVGNSHGSRVPPGLKPKDRCAIPERFVLAMQADGWWYRDQIVWAKKAPMPSSVTDQTTPAHEMVYMFTRAAKYFYDQIAIQEPAVSEHEALGDARPAPVARGGRGSEEPWVPSSVTFQRESKK